jgi:hypothetical protein
MKPRMCSVWAWKYIYVYVSISSNHKCCIEGGLINFNYKRNLTFRIILAFFPSLVANLLRHNHLVEPGVEGWKVTSQVGSQGLNQSCSPRRDLSNDVSHSQIWCQEEVDSWLLVVGSQIADVQMANARLFSISMLQDLSNDTNNSSMRVVLGLSVEL